MIEIQEAHKNIENFNLDERKKEQKIINQKVEIFLNIANSFISDSSKNGKSDTMMCFAYKTIKDTFNILPEEKESVAEEMACLVMHKLQKCGYKTRISNNKAIQSVNLTIMW